MKDIKKICINWQEHVLLKATSSNVFVTAALVCLYRQSADENGQTCMGQEIFRLQTIL